MRRKRMVIIGLLLLSMILIGCASQQRLAFKLVEEKKHQAVTPVQSTFDWAIEWWGPRHEAVNERIKKGNVDMLFIGNSITHGWENEGKEVWDTYYGHRNAVNMGFGGDWTQHVLWRLDHSDLENISPKLAVILIGTNNSNGDDNTPEEIADGIITICQRLRNRLPSMKILLLGIFPRGPEPSAQREKNRVASLRASRISDDKMIHYLNINQIFLAENGILTKDIMPDYLHLSEKGYRMWAEAMEPKVAQLLGETK